MKQKINEIKITITAEIDGRACVIPATDAQKHIILSLLTDDNGTLPAVALPSEYKLWEIGETK